MRRGHSVDPGKNEFGSIYNLSYCEQSALPYDGDKLPCEFYENIGAQVIHSDSIIIVTRQKVMEQELVCDAAIAATRPDGTCPFIFNSTSETSARGARVRTNSAGRVAATPRLPRG